VVAGTQVIGPGAASGGRASTAPWLVAWPVKSNNGVVCRRNSDTNENQTPANNCSCLPSSLRVPNGKEKVSTFNLVSFVRDFAGAERFGAMTAISAISGRVQTPNSYDHT